MGFVINVKCGVWSIFWWRFVRLFVSFWYWRRKISEGCLKVMFFCVVLCVLVCLMRVEWSLIMCWVCVLKIFWRGVFKCRCLSLVWWRVFIMFVFLLGKDIFGKLYFLKLMFFEFIMLILWIEFKYCWIFCRVCWMF